MSVHCGRERRGSGRAAVFSRRGLRLRTCSRSRLASLILIAIPGPSVLFVISRGVVLGRRAALATVAGNCAGVYVPGDRRRARDRRARRAVGRDLQHDQARRARSTSSGSACGRSRSAARSPRRSGSRPRRRAAAGSCATASSSGSRTRRRRCSSPRSCRSSSTPRSGTCRCRCWCSGSSSSLIALVVDSVWGLVAGTARERLVASPRRLEAIGGASGVVLVGLGVGLAVTGRKP